MDIMSGEKKTKGKKGKKKKKWEKSGKNRIVFRPFVIPSAYTTCFLSSGLEQESLCLLSVLYLRCLHKHNTVFLLVLFWCWNKGLGLLAGGLGVDAERR